MTRTYPFDKSKGNAKSMPILIFAAGMLVIGVFAFDAPLLAQGVVFTLALLGLVYGFIRLRASNRFIERIAIRDGVLTYYLFTATQQPRSLPAGAILSIEEQRILFKSPSGQVVAVANRNQFYGKRSWQELLADLETLVR